jgi:hypothetical protein
VLFSLEENQASDNCPECGAPIVEGLTCWEQLGMLISWEFDDPELAAEHFLTVACHNLQHPAQFTDDAQAWLRSALIERLDHGLRVEELRRQASRAYKGSKRVLKAKSERRPVLRSWSMTLADVYLPGRREGAAARVRAWASAIRSEM